MAFNVGAIIRAARKRKNITVAAMAELMGVTQPTITRWENGPIDMPTSALVRYCEILGITPGELFADVEVEVPSHLRQLIDSARRLTPDQVEALNNFLKSITTAEPPAQYEPAAPAEPEPEPKPEQTWSRWEPLAAHREDGDFMGDFPDEVIQNIEEFKRFHIEETEKERKKKKGE